MAKITLHPIFKDIRGKFDNHVFRRTSSGQLSVTKLPDMSNVQWSEAQIANRNRFREANIYAKAALDDPAVRAHYEEQATRLHKPAYKLAVTDYLNGINLLEK